MDVGPGDPTAATPGIPGHPGDGTPNPLGTGAPTAAPTAPTSTAAAPTSTAAPISTAAPTSTAAPSVTSRKVVKADRIVLTIVCLAQFMVILDVSIVNVALPSIQKTLGFSQANLQWVVTVYSLTFGGLLLLGGRLADLVGRRRIFLVGLALFTGSSLVGGFAQNQATLIAARGLQGIGAAVLSPATLTILTVTFTDQRARAKALGVWGAVAAGGGASGALIGGILTQYLSWRWILFVNVPIGVLLFLFARLFLAESRVEAQRRRLDFAGSITVTAGLLALVYTIVHTDEVSWTSPSTLISGAVAIVLLGSFVAIEAVVAEQPLVPLGIFRSRAVTAANLVMFCFGMAMFAMWFFLTLYLQEVLGYDPVITGLTFLPQTAAIAVGTTVAGRLAPRFGPRPVMMAGAFIGASGLYWLSFIQPGDTYWTGACGGGILATLGMGLAFTPVTLAATGGVRPDQAGLASGLVNSSRQIGASLGLAVLSTVAASRITTLLSGKVPTPELERVAKTAGYAHGFLIASVVALAGGFVAMAIPRKVTPIGVSEPATVVAIAGPAVGDAVARAPGGGAAVPRLAD